MRLYWGYTGIMEKKMETAGIIGFTKHKWSFSKTAISKHKK